jgi:hypothetical protein
MMFARRPQLGTKERREVLARRGVVLQVAEREDRVEVAAQHQVGSRVLGARRGRRDALGEAAWSRLARDVAGRVDDRVPGRGLPVGRRRVRAPAGQALQPLAGGADRPQLALAGRPARET